MSEKLEEFDNRIIFAKTLIALANENPKIVVVCNDSVGSSNLGEFRDLFPDRLIDVGIAEQNMVGVAAGLANAGFTPFVCAAAPFLTGRALEQIKADVVYTRTNVKLCGMSPGISYGELGPTHHSIEDIAWIHCQLFCQQMKHKQKALFVGPRLQMDLSLCALAASKFHQFHKARVQHLFPIKRCA